jgi:hypothetical protein
MAILRLLLVARLVRALALLEKDKKIILAIIYGKNILEYLLNTTGREIMIKV